MIGIYAIKNIINGKLYIGLSSKIEKRFLYHKKCLIKNKHLNKHLQSSFNKIGIDNFEFYIIEECSIEELNDKEKYYIDLYKTYDNNYGYNKTYGGGFGKMSEEINEQRRQKLKLQVVSHEMRKRISNTLTGRIIPKEVVEKRALACRKCSDEIEEKIIELYKEKTQKEISIVLDIKVTTVVSVLNRHKIKKK